MHERHDDDLVRVDAIDEGEWETSQELLAVAGIDLVAAL